MTKLTVSLSPASHTGSSPDGGRLLPWVLAGILRDFRWRAGSCRLGGLVKVFGVACPLGCVDCEGVSVALKLVGRGVLRLRLVACFQEVACFLSFILECGGV